MFFVFCFSFHCFHCFHFVFTILYFRYHSHPFDVDKNPQYFFSSTDCQNQVVWQRGNDPYGDPFVGIVIDPLRSIAKGRPEIGSFRAFLPAYSQTIPMAPDGTLVTSENKTEGKKYIF